MVLLRYADMAARRFGRLLARLHRSLRNRLARVHPSPILMLGNQKSGTTAIAALLAAATGHRATLDLEDLTPDVFLDLLEGRLPVRALITANRHDFSAPIVKEPALTFLYGRLLEELPAARFVLIVRDPRDNIRSILDRVGLSGREELGLDMIPEDLDAKWRFNLLSTGLGIEGDSCIERLALRWNQAADVYLLYPDRVTMLRYEDFMAAKETTIRSLAAELGLVPSSDIADRLDVQYQPAGASRHLPRKEFFSRQNLALIEAICGNRMQQLGYAADA
jgi:hypothetical protein